MIYPSLQQYINAIENGKEQFRTLRKVIPIRDDHGDLIYRSSHSSVVFSVRLDKSECSLRVFTCESGIKYAKGQILEKELYVASKGKGDYYDVVVEECVDSFVSQSKEDTTEQIASENRIAFTKDDKWGFRDNNGKIAVPAIYDSVQEFSEGRAVVESGSMYGLIDKSGKIIIPLCYDEMSYDGSHLCYVDLEGKCGVVDRMGRAVVEPEWDWVSEFAQGMLLVERDGLYGYVDLKGCVVIEPQFQNATSFDDNRYATVKLDGREYQIDPDGNRV